MSTALALTGKDLEAFVVRGDLGVLPPEAKAAHYVHLCGTLGLDPQSKPFEYLKLNGKEILYATKGAAEQLRKLHKVAITITSREMTPDVYIVTALATLPDGRTDESVGAVGVAGLKGDALCNAIMKSETKAKRRVTLSCLGLGMLDESELETIPRDRFENMPQPVRSVQPAQAIKALPRAVADDSDKLPSQAIKAMPSLSDLAAKKYVEMDTSELEQIQQAIMDFLPKAKTDEGRKQLNEIGSRCQDLLNERAGQ